MGIGEAIAMTLAENGMNVALLARSGVCISITLVPQESLTRNQPKLEAVKARIESKCPNIKVRAYSVDIQSHAEVNAAVELIVSALGDIEVLINNVSLLSGFEIRDVKTDPRQRLGSLLVHRGDSGNYRLR